MNDKNNILEVKNLKVRFNTDEGMVYACNDVSYQVGRGKSIGIVGESGCGKSVSAYSILQLLPPNAEIYEGEITYKNDNNEIQNITNLNPKSQKMRKIRGAQISMVFQEPMTAFSPVHTIKNQISEKILLHQDIQKHAAHDRAIELLDLVKISNPEKTIEKYPFQLSGGMIQRAMIAMGLACEPKILIADEPTTALDVTIQAQVLKLIRDMQNDFNLSLILITHDLGVIAHMTEHVYVMYLGSIVEDGPVKQLFNNPLHPYTQDLLKSIPTITKKRKELSSIQGSVPDAYNLPSGCFFHTRCQKIYGQICREKKPIRQEAKNNHYVSCFHYIQKEVQENA